MVLILSLPLACSAKDVVRTVSGESETDRRITHKQEVLKAALDATRSKYGDYEIQLDQTYMNPSRAFHELTIGKAINVHFALTNGERERTATPIRIPVRRGMASYRLLLIHKDSLKAFEKVETLEDLKRLRVGLNKGWTNYAVMQSQGFNVVPLGNYDSMFGMLSLQRCDYLLRAVNEVYDEIEARQHSSVSLAVAPGIAVYLPSVTYIFVSKSEPRLAQRLTEGMQILVANGTLERLFDKHHAASIAKAGLDKRKLLYVPNPLLPGNIPWSDKRLWMPMPACMQDGSLNCN